MQNPLDLIEEVIFPEALSESKYLAAELPSKQSSSNEIAKVQIHGEPEQVLCKSHLM